MKEIRIIKNRSDIGAGTRGSDMGIDAIEIAAINKDNDYFTKYEFVDVKTENESVYNKNKNSFAKRIDSVFQQCQRVSNNVKVTIQEGMLPIVLSGDHSSALGTISGVKAAYPNKRVGVIWVDAHGDLHSPYTSPSGNIHGMPLAAAISEDNMEYSVNEVSRDTSELWDRMKHVGVPKQKIQPEDLIFFGVRDTETPEDALMEKYDIKNYTVSEMRYRGFDVCLEEAIAKLNDCDVIYVSFDVDSMDCDMVSYGTGTPVAKGFDKEEVLHIINAFVKTNKVACFEIVEVNPLLDFKGNKMAETAFEVLDNVTNTFNGLK